MGRGGGYCPEGYYVLGDIVVESLQTVNIPFLIANVLRLT